MQFFTDVTKKSWKLLNSLQAESNKKSITSTNIPAHNGKIKLTITQPLINFLYFTRYCNKTMSLSLLYVDKNKNYDETSILQSWHHVGNMCQWLGRILHNHMECKDLSKVCHCFQHHHEQFDKLFWSLENVAVACTPYPYYKAQSVPKHLHISKWFDVSRTLSSFESYIFPIFPLGPYLNHQFLSKKCPLCINQFWTKRELFTLRRRWSDTSCNEQKWIIGTLVVLASTWQWSILTFITNSWTVFITIQWNTNSTPLPWNWSG